MSLFSIRKHRAKRSTTYSANIDEMANILAEKVKAGFTVEEFNALEFEMQLKLLSYKKSEPFADVRGAAELLTPGLLVSTHGSHTDSSSCGFGSRSYTSVFGSAFYVGKRGLLLLASIERPFRIIMRDDEDDRTEESEHRILNLGVGIDTEGKYVHYKGPLVGHRFVENCDGPIHMNRASSHDGRVPLTDYSFGQSHYYGAQNNFFIKPKLEEKVRAALEESRAA